MPLKSKFISVSSVPLCEYHRNVSILWNILPWNSKITMTLIKFVVSELIHEFKPYNRMYLMSRPTITLFSVIGIHCIKNYVLSVQKHHEEISNPINTVTLGVDRKLNVSDNSSFYSDSFENSIWNNTVTLSPSAPPLDFDNNLCKNNNSSWIIWCCFGISIRDIFDSLQIMLFTLRLSHILCHKIAIFLRHLY